MFRREAQSLIRKGSTPKPSLYFKQTPNIMNVIKTAIDGVVIFEPRVFEDIRGYFFESFSQREFNEKVLPLLQTSAI